MTFKHRRGLGLAAILLTACSHQSPASDIGTSTDTSASRIAALHAAAQCLRSHGVVNFADPVLGATGQVFTDARPLQDTPSDVVDAAMSACERQLRTASWNPETQPPAPAALVAAGVKSAQCLRQNGLPNMHDPTAESVYTPGHGFGVTASDVPPGVDKRSPVMQHAFQACRTLLDAEIRASTLDQLSGR
jgi:hypothetical protein